MNTSNAQSTRLLMQLPGMKHSYPPRLASLGLKACNDQSACATDRAAAFFCLHCAHQGLKKLSPWERMRSSIWRTPSQCRRGLAHRAVPPTSTNGRGVNVDAFFLFYGAHFAKKFLNASKTSLNSLFQKKTRFFTSRTGASS